MSAQVPPAGPGSDDPGADSARQDAAVRCSAAARRRGDLLAGTASTVRAFLLLEEPGPWGVVAWRDARLADGLGESVLRRCAALGVRPLLIRRPVAGAPRVGPAGTPSVAAGHVGAGRVGAGGGRRVFAAYVDADGGWVEAGTVADPREVLDLDLRALRSGRSVGLQAWREPVFAVCTHGRHDPCCAERGRPTALALAAVEPDAGWAVSHLGGDRFAANLLVLGDGLYYGGLDEHSVGTLVAQHRAGWLDLDRLRGRTCWPMSVQAAEIGLRRQLGMTGRRDLQLRARHADGELVHVRFAPRHPGPGADPADWLVTVQLQSANPVALTCHATLPRPLTTWRVVDCRRAAPGSGG